MKKLRRWQIMVAIALVVVVLLTLFAAPSGNLPIRGSIYDRTPEGYGAWYAYMQKRNVKIQVWQKNLAALVAANHKKAALIRVYNIPASNFLSNIEKNWLKQGNVLIILGVQGQATQADFRSKIPSSVGLVEIASTRRFSPKNSTLKAALLADDFGAVVWEEKPPQNYEKAEKWEGKRILSTTPYLGANAYQDAQGNYAFLAELIPKEVQTIWIDEYIHGYKDVDVKVKEGAKDLLSYLDQTPLSVALIQTIVVLLVLLWGYNRRFGSITKLKTPTVDNSTAYMQALAAVLHKAESSDFVMQSLGKAEQLRLQQALGLGQTLLEPAELIAAFKQQTNLPTADLQQLLNQVPKRRVGESQLLSWLIRWQKLRSQIKS